MNEHEFPETATVPEATLQAVAGADRPGSGPQAGELWRAGLPGGEITLVWVRSPAPGGAMVVPVSFDVEQADERTVIVPDEASPLGLALAVHTGIEAVIDTAAFRDRLGMIEPRDGWPVGPGVTSLLDQRIEYHEGLADQLAALAPAGTTARQPPEEDGQWWPLDAPSERSALLMALHQALGGPHPGARVSPRPPALAASEHLSALALVAELDAFVLVATLDHTLDAAAQLEAARAVLHGDQLLSAVCLVQPSAPFTAVVIDRRDVVDAIETPGGVLRPPRQSRPPAPMSEALTKFLDTTISPFGRLASTVVAGPGLDPRGLAVDVAGEAVRSVEGSAKGFKVEGKRPGYERVKRHRNQIVRLVEEALNGNDVDVASILEEPG